jgi:DNA polymerase III epsilon subunit-like protein
MSEFPKNFVVIDLETTGLDPERCQILEIGAVDAAGRRFYRRCAITRGCRVDWPALECNGIDALDLGEGIHVGEALCDLMGWLLGNPQINRWIIGGKNPEFDYRFLRANWPDPNLSQFKEVISRRCVDLHSLVYGMALRSGWDMTADDFSTDDLYRSLGLEPEPKPHNALRGAIHEMEGFRRVLLGAAAAMPKGEFDALMLALERENLQPKANCDLSLTERMQKINRVYGRANA